MVAITIIIIATIILTSTDTASCVTFYKSLNISEPQFLHLYDSYKEL